MKNNDLLELIGHADDELVEKSHAAMTTRKKHIGAKRWLPVAACVAIIALAVPAAKYAYDHYRVPIIGEKTTDTGIGPTCDDETPSTDENHTRDFPVSSDTTSPGSHELQKITITFGSLEEIRELTAMKDAGEDEVTRYIAANNLQVCGIGNRKDIEKFIADTEKAVLTIPTDESAVLTSVVYCGQLGYINMSYNIADTTLLISNSLNGGDPVIAVVENGCGTIVPDNSTDFAKTLLFELIK